MVVIRLARFGAKKRPFYKIVVTDKRNPRNGRFIEHVGYFNPLNKENSSFNFERINYWLNVGAQTSKRVESLLKNAKKNI